MSKRSRKPAPCSQSTLISNLSISTDGRDITYRTDKWGIPGTSALRISQTGRATIILDGVSYGATRIAWFYHTGAWPTSNVKRFIDSNFSKENLYISVAPYLPQYTPPDTKYEPIAAPITNGQAILNAIKGWGSMWSAFIADYISTDEVVDKFGIHHTKE